MSTSLTSWHLRLATRSPRIMQPITEKGRTLMNKFRRTTLLALAAFAVGGVSAQAGAATLQEIKDRGVVRIAVANEIPYGYMDMDGTAKGPGPDAAKHIMEQLGIKKIEWVTTNFGSLIPGLSAN